jgi:hypothetical protein
VQKVPISRATTNRKRQLSGAASSAFEGVVRGILIGTSLRTEPPFLHVKGAWTEKPLNSLDASCTKIKPYVLDIFLRKLAYSYLQFVRIEPEEKKEGPAATLGHISFVMTTFPVSCLNTIF